MRRIHGFTNTERALDQNTGPSVVALFLQQERELLDRRRDFAIVGWPGCLLDRSARSSDRLASS